jgi:hypothetical protein
MKGVSNTADAVYRNADLVLLAAQHSDCDSCGQADDVPILGLSARRLSHGRDGEANRIGRGGQMIEPTDAEIYDQISYLDPYLSGLTEPPSRLPVFLIGYVIGIGAGFFYRWIWGWFR